MDSIALEFSIPADDDGYILLQCGHCGEYFKLTAEDCENDDILRIVCPVSIPLSEVHAICYRSPHNPLKKSIFFKS